MNQGDEITELTDVGRQHYGYTSLLEASNPETEYNVYGVVVNFVRGRGSKGSHKYYASYTLIDPSLPTTHTAVSVNIFANELKNLPEPTHIGSIVRFHRLKFQTFNQARQLYGRLTELNPATGKSFMAKGSTTSSLLCLRKTHYLTSVPLYYGVDAAQYSRSVVPIAAPAAAAPIAAPPAAAPPAAGNASSSSAIAPGSPVAAEAVVTANVPTAALDVYSYFNLNEWVIHNPQHGVQNTFRRADMERLVSLNIWAEQQLMNQISLNDGLVLNNACAESLHAACLSRAQQGQHFIDSKFDVICMVAFVVPPTEYSGNKVSLCVFDGSSAMVPPGGVAPTVQGLATTTSDAELLGPRYVDFLSRKMYLSMTNAALFSECKTLADKRAVEATLDNGEAIDALETEDEQTEAMRQQMEPPRTLHGQLYRIECATSEESDYLTRILKLEPGMWVRIRGLHTSPEVGGGTRFPCVGVVQKDTGIGILQPYFQDVSKLAARYFYHQLQVQQEQQAVFERQQQQQQQQQSRSNAKGKQQPQPQQQHQGQGQQQQSRGRILHSSLGVDYSILASCLATVPPAEFCCRLRIVDFYPQDVSQFVRMIPASSTGPARPVFMFTLVVEDESCQADVICFGEDAEFLFGGLTATMFLENDSIQHAVESTLNRCIDADFALENGDSSIDFYLWSYKTPVASNAAIASSPGPIRKDNKHQYSTRIKVVHTKLFSFDEVA